MVKRFPKSNPNERNHSFTSLLSCLEHFLAIGKGSNNYYETVPGNEYDDNASTPFPKPSRRVYEIKANSKKRIPSTNQLPVFCSSFVTFHDDFDPTVSIVKANRNGVWDYHLQFDVGYDAHEFSNTYVLSLGPKGEDHDDVMQTIQSEINILSEGRCPPMFDGKRKEMVQPYLEVRLKHGDQPDRRATNGLKGGKATNHARWRTSFDYKNRRHFLPSCDECRVRLNSRFTTPEFDTSFVECGTKCTSWSMDPKHIILHSSPPKDFPEDKIPDTGLLPPLLEFEFDELNRSAIEAHDNILSGKWNPKNAIAFLSYKCFKTDLASEIIEHSMNMKLHMYLLSKNGQGDANGPLATIEIDKEKNPSTYKRRRLPPTWSAPEPLYLYHDAPMHLYSGLVKAVMKLTVTVLKKRGMFGNLLSTVSSGKFNAYEKLSLPWFPLIPYRTDKFASYSCSNHIALGRFLKSHCVDISVLKEPPPVNFPSENQSQWNMVFNKSWLSIRDLDTNGNAQELRERVAQFMEDPHCPSPSVHINLKTKHVVRMLCSTYNVLSHLLARDVNNSHLKRTHLSILRCLNDIDHIDSLIRKKK